MDVKQYDIKYYVQQEKPVSLVEIFGAEELHLFDTAVQFTRKVSPWILTIPKINSEEPLARKIEQLGPYFEPKTELKEELKDIYSSWVKGVKY